MDEDQAVSLAVIALVVGGVLFTAAMLYVAL
jgi:hypothetical protein